MNGFGIVTSRIYIPLNSNQRIFDRSPPQSHLLLSNRLLIQRFVSLLTPLKLEDRLFESLSEITDPVKLLNALDYSEASKQLEIIRSDSLNWLRNALSAPKKITSKAIYNVYCDNM